jgi:hypothetical protein
MKDNLKVSVGAGTWMGIAATVLAWAGAALAQAADEGAVSITALVVGGVQLAIVLLKRYSQAEKLLDQQGTDRLLGIGEPVDPS